MAALYKDSWGAKAQSKLAECYKEGIGVYREPQKAMLLKMGALKIQYTDQDNNTLQEYLE